MKQRFSERNNLSVAKEILAPEAVNSQFRKALFDVLYSNFLTPVGRFYTWPNISRTYQREFENKTLDEISNLEFTNAIGWLKVCVLAEWELPQLFDFIELIIEDNQVELNFRNELSNVFKNNQIKYLVDLENNIILPKISDTETNAIKMALNNTENYLASKVHLEDAVRKLAEGKYSKSIAESVHAIESLIRKLTEDDKIEIPTGLKKLSIKHPIHGAFSGAIDKLYAYSGDVPGARHSAISLKESVSKQDAQFVLVTSAAFITYLIDTFVTQEQNIAA